MKLKDYIYFEVFIFNIFLFLNSDKQKFMATSLKILLFILTSNFAWSFKRFRYIAARIILHLSVLNRNETSLSSQVSIFLLEHQFPIHIACFFVQVHICRTAQYVTVIFPFLLPFSLLVFKTLHVT
jgi:hypothetical protein